jgi:Holliday junction resolvasome RuvABC endonuclease subunit
MRVLAFDQSTKVTGWSLFVDEKYIDSGVIDLSKNKDTVERSKQMALAICQVIIDNRPDTVIIEEVAMQSNAQTLKLLARIQGVAIGFCAAHNIPLHILEPSKWRSALDFKQGRAVKREELKSQSLDYVKENFGFKNFSEDRSEAICINVAAHKIFDLDDEI